MPAERRRFVEKQARWAASDREMRVHFTVHLMNFREGKLSFLRGETLC